MSKFEMVPWNLLSSHLNHVSLQGMAEDEHLANVQRVKDRKRGNSFYWGPFMCHQTRRRPLVSFNSAGPPP